MTRLARIMRRRLTRRRGWAASVCRARARRRQALRSISARRSAPAAPGRQGVAGRRRQGSRVAQRAVEVAVVHLALGAGQHGVDAVARRSPTRRTVTTRESA